MCALTVLLSHLCHHRVVKPQVFSGYARHQRTHLKSLSSQYVTTFYSTKTTHIKQSIPCVKNAFINKNDWMKTWFFRIRNGSLLLVKKKKKQQNSHILLTQKKKKKVWSSRQKQGHKDTFKNLYSLSDPETYLNWQTHTHNIFIWGWTHLHYWQSHQKSPFLSILHSYLSTQIWTGTWK